MPDADHTSIRVYHEGPLAEGAHVICSPEQASYLRGVMRLPSGAGLLVFDGRSGEYRARLAHDGKRGAALDVGQATREQPPASDIWLLFAPLKHARLDYMVQKAVEMGAGRLWPVITRHTQATRVNRERMRANVIEAAEQCGVLAVPDVAGEARLDTVLDAWDPARRLVFCDERAGVGDPVAALRALGEGPLAVLIGPEGGFSDEERARLLRARHVQPIAIGPRILRADTAAVAAMAVVQTSLGDWR